MADSLQLRVVTPEKSLLEKEVSEVQVPGLEGYLGMLPGHAPLFSELMIGELTYESPDGGGSLAVAKGFVEVLDDEVRVLADVAEEPASIDVERARSAQSRAEGHISGSGEGVDFERAQAALQRAVVRIQVAGKSGR